MSQALPREYARSTTSRWWRRRVLALVVGALTLFGVASTLPAAAEPTGTGVIKGYVYADAGNDGFFDVNEAPIADVEVTLQSGGAEVASVRTDEAGQFAFEGLRAGTYRLLEQQPKDYRDGVEVAGGGGVLLNNDLIEVTLREGEVSSGHLFGEVPAEPGVSNPDFPIVVAGHTLVFDPLANDGVLGDATAAFDPKTVRLLDPATGQPASTLLLPGQVQLRVTDDGRIEIRPQAGFQGWAAEVGYQASTRDGRHSTSVIGVEVRQKLTPDGAHGRRILPNR